MTGPEQSAPPRPRGWPKPGVVAIACLLLLESGGTTFAVLPLFARRDPRAAPAAIAAALLFLGGAGLMRQKRWGWALAMATSMLTACYSLYLAIAMRALGPVFPAALFTVFFLYLMRPEVRERMH